MKRRLLISIALVMGFVTNVLADEFVVKNFKLAPSDISARKYERLDINDEKCALIKIRTDIDGLSFDPRLGAEGNVEFKNGEYWLYVTSGEKVIKIIKNGFISMDYVIPVKIKSSNVYKMDLTGSDRYTIRINTNPSNIDFEMDGKKYTTNQGILDVSPGSHIIKIEKPMYETLIDTIYVSKTKLFFEYDLKKLKRVLVKFATNPPGAILMLDGSPIGVTPKDHFSLTGEHKLTVTLDKYITIDTSIVLVEGQNNFDFNLNKNACFLTVYKYPIDAEIKINGKLHEASVEHEIEATEQTISVSCDKFYPFDTTFVAIKGEKYKIVANLQRETGNLMILANPSDTDFELIKGEDDVILSWNGSNTFESIAADQYNIRAFRKGYKEQFLPVNIVKEETQDIEFNMEELSVKKGSKFTAISLSLVIPGAGQLYSGKKRGWFYMGGVAGGIATAVIEQKKVDAFRTAKENYDNATSSSQITLYRDEMTNLHDDAIKAAKIRNYGLIAAGALYGINVLDAILTGNKQEVAKKQKKISMIAYPVNNTVAVGINYKFK